MQECWKETDPLHFISSGATRTYTINVENAGKYKHYYLHVRAFTKDEMFVPPASDSYLSLPELREGHTMFEVRTLDDGVAGFPFGGGVVAFNQSAWCGMFGCDSLYNTTGANDLVYLGNEYGQEHAWILPDISVTAWPLIQTAEFNTVFEASADTVVWQAFNSEIIPPPPTPAPTMAPTPAPTMAPTPAPTMAPTMAPTPAPTSVRRRLLQEPNTLPTVGVCQTFTSFGCQGNLTAFHLYAWDDEFVDETDEVAFEIRSAYAAVEVYDVTVSDHYKFRATVTLSNGTTIYLGGGPEQGAPFVVRPDVQVWETSMALVDREPVDEPVYRVQARDRFGNIMAGSVNGTHWQLPLSNYVPVADITATTCAGQAVQGFNGTAPVMADATRCGSIVTSLSAQIINQQGEVVPGVEGLTLINDICVLVEAFSASDCFCDLDAVKGIAKDIFPVQDMVPGEWAYTWSKVFRYCLEDAGHAEPGRGGGQRRVLQTGRALTESGPVPQRAHAGGVSPRRGVGGSHVPRGHLRGRVPHGGPRLVQPQHGGGRPRARQHAHRAAGVPSPGQPGVLPDPRPRPHRHPDRPAVQHRDGHHRGDRRLRRLQEHHLRGGRGRGAQRHRLVQDRRRGCDRARRPRVWDDGEPVDLQED